MDLAAMQAAIRQGWYFTGSHAQREAISQCTPRLKAGACHWAEARDHRLIDGNRCVSQHVRVPCQQTVDSR